MKKETESPGELISAYTFAERKGVKNTAVYYRIKKGEIETTPVGKFNLIDWEKYKHIEFPQSYKDQRSENFVEVPKADPETKTA
jgi:hypothetical protein